MISEITAEELDEMIEDHEELLIVDVREPGEFRDGHIPGALNRPLETTGSGEFAAARGRTVVLYSNHGRRSAQAAAHLRGRGHEPVYSLSGGLARWQAAGMAVVRETPK